MKKLFYFTIILIAFLFYSAFLPYAKADIVETASNIPICEDPQHMEQVWIIMVKMGFQNAQFGFEQLVEQGHCEYYSGEIKVNGLIDQIIVQMGSNITSMSFVRVLINNREYYSIVNPNI